jgi:hypothetical protein
MGARLSCSVTVCASRPIYTASSSPVPRACGGEAPGIKRGPVQVGASRPGPWHRFLQTISETKPHM